MITHPTTETTPPLDVEYAFLGCLLRLPHSEARAVLSGMRPDDCGQPAAAHALHLVIQVVAAGHDPHPTTVFAHAQTTGAVTGESHTHNFARWLLTAYEAAPAPAAAEHLKTVVLEHAWRRALADYAARLARAAEDAPVDVLADLADDTGPTDAYQRYRADRDHPPATDGPRRLGVAA